MLKLTPVFCCTGDPNAVLGKVAAADAAVIANRNRRVNQSVWNGKIDTPKTPNAIRKIAISQHLAALLAGQAEIQRAKKHDFLFSTSTGRPWDISLFRKRKLQPLLSALEIEAAGLHAFRHFNASLLGSLRTPLKTIQERLGHALTGSLTLEVYTHAEWKENDEAAKLAGDAIEKAVNSVSLTAIQTKRLPTRKSEALAA